MGSFAPRPSEPRVSGAESPRWGCGVTLGETPSWAGGQCRGSLLAGSRGNTFASPLSLRLPMAGGCGGAGTGRCDPSS